ncbi:MAG: cation-translocating P-type ATPase [Archangiaceae bacterium]|nr:cation-translocating P-type ATPase [Archangiaceae bacterium]
MRSPATGLSTAEARQRLSQHGPNQLERGHGPSALSMLAGQFKSPVVLLLLGACVVSGVLREVADAVAIGAIVVLNAVVGFFQEYRAERAMEALRSMTAPRARVRRDGVTAQLPAAEVVPGDLLVLEAGDVVAADARVLEAHRLATNEAPLTGESAQVEKSAQACPADAPLAERFDAVFMGTSVGTGTGLAEVTATGMRTELGRIAKLLATASEGETPLQHRLARVSRMLLFACLGIAAVVAVAGLLRGLTAFDVFLSAVSLAVAAVPEGLPAMVTIALAVGVRRMVSRHVLVRKLPAVETLGCATVICTDKTGTLTTGVMTVRELWGPDRPALLDAAVACCDAELETGVGDTTELAILAAAAEQGIRRAAIEAARPRVAEVPFDSLRRRMSVSRSDGHTYVKGAVEAVLPGCVAGTAGAAEANARLSQRGLRVLAVAVGDGTEDEPLRLSGLVGIADPPRPEAVAAVAAARAAGIETVMITGDHPLTAQAIAAELGITHVHARATPEDKLKIVRAWKEKGAVVAMTGDGVNDAPALREAHIGVCMGKTGTEVTREASDMVLTDDDFASIVAAVREGRGIFDNIRKSLVYLLSGNTAELAVMLVAALVGLPVPLIPLQLLWINLVTDGFPALALVMDPADPDVMKRPPRPTDEPMLGRREWLRIVGPGVLVAALTLAAYGWALGHRSEAEARSLAFAIIVLTQLLMVFGSRSPTRVFWEMGAFSNLTLLAVICASVAAQLLLQHLSVMVRLFHLAPLTVGDWALAFAAGLIPVTIIELLKLARRALHARV